MFRSPEEQTERAKTAFRVMKSLDKLGDENGANFIASVFEREELYRYCQNDDGKAYQSWEQFVTDFNKEVALDH